MARGDATPVSLAPALAGEEAGAAGWELLPQLCQGLCESPSEQIPVYLCVCPLANCGPCWHDVDNLKYPELKAAALGAALVTVLNCLTPCCCCCQEMFPAARHQMGHRQNRSLVFSGAQAAFLHPCTFTARRERQITHRVVCTLPDFLY